METNPWGSWAVVILILGAMLVVGLLRRLHASPLGRKEAPPLTEFKTAKYRVGQTWNFKTRPGEEGATLTVARVESSPGLGVRVHVSLNGLRIKSPRALGGFTDTLPHAPFSDAAIEGSVTALVGEGKTLPGFEDGYRQWRRAFDDGRGGVFTISVAEAITFAEEALNK